MPGPTPPLRAELANWWTAWRLTSYQSSSVTKALLSALFNHQMSLMDPYCTWLWNYITPQMRIKSSKHMLGGFAKSADNLTTPILPCPWDGRGSLGDKMFLVFPGLKLLLDSWPRDTTGTLCLGQTLGFQRYWSPESLAVWQNAFPGRACCCESCKVRPMSCALCSRKGVPNLQDLKPDDLRCSWCNNNGNKVHNKYNALESSPNRLPRNLVHGKTDFHETGRWRKKGWGPLP